MHLQRGYVDCIESEDKNNGITIIAKSNEASEYCYIYIYIYVGSMAIEGRRPESYWHVIKIATYLQMEMQQILLLHMSSEKSIG